MMLIENITKKLLLHGTIQKDLSLCRMVKEFIGYELQLSGHDFEILAEYKLNQKYQEELLDIQNWYWTDLLSLKSRRQVVYFNNDDFIKRLQCISLFQIIDDTLIIYQRSGDVVKMKDDFRFFLEIKLRWFNDIKYIKIFYGSLHLKIEENE